jgi:Na+/phosphate symporter
MMTLRQSLGMLLGADVGSSCTVQLFAYKFYTLAPLLIAAGYLLSLAPETKRVSLYGKLMLAIGFIFFGMHYMGQAVEPLRSLPAFNALIISSLTNPWYGLIVGTAFTAIVQSSAGTIAILLALPLSFRATGTWQPDMANYLPLIIGANFGTCITAFIATLRANLEGLRVAWAHCLFKVIGVCIVFPLVPFLHRLLPHSGISMEMQIANAHMLFNVFLSIVCLPLLTPFSEIVLRFVRKKASTAPAYHAQFLNNNVLNLPAVALAQALREISRMSELVVRMVEKSHDVIQNVDNDLIKKIARQDDEVDFLHESIIRYCTSISKTELSHEESAKAYEQIMVTTELEHIGDVASKSIVELAGKIESSPYPLSAEGRQEILEFFGKTSDLLKKSIAAFTLSDKKLAMEVFESKAAFKKDFESYYDRHLERLYRRKIESLQTTSIHIDLIEEIDRINHFSFRIAAHVLAIYKAE